jgi:putative hemolysin
MVAGVFRLDTLRVEALMTPRTGLVWFDVDDTIDTIRQKLTGNQYSRFPVCEGSLDNVIGLVAARDLLMALLSERPIELRALAKPALFIPQTATASDTLDRFRGQESTAAMVIGEYGGVEGIITVTDVLEAIVGDFEEPEIMQRDDGSWLIDGLMPVDEFRDMVELRDQLPGEEENLYQTLAGFIMTHQGHIPRTGEHFEWRHFYFEVVDMDGNRVDKVLVRRLETPAAPGDKRTTGETVPAKSTPESS